MTDITNDIPLIIAGELPRPASPGEAVIRGEDGRPVAQWMLRGEEMSDKMLRHPEDDPLVRHGLM